MPCLSYPSHPYGHELHVTHTQTGLRAVMFEHVRTSSKEHVQYSWHVYMCVPLGTFTCRHHAVATCCCNENDRFCVIVNAVSTLLIKKIGVCDRCLVTEHAQPMKTT